MATRKPHVTFLAFITNLIAGLQKKPPAGAPKLTILTQLLTIPQLITALTAIQQVLLAVATAKQSYSKAVAAAKVMETAQKAFIDAVKKALIYAYGTDTDGLQGCGITGPKPRVTRTVEQKAVAKARAKATRAGNKPAPKPTPTVTVTDVDGTPIGATAPAAPASNTTTPAVPAVVAAATVTGH